jgi:hypothetical protein
MEYLVCSMFIEPEVSGAPGLLYSMFNEPEVWSTWSTACFMRPRYEVIGLQHV